MLLLLHQFDDVAEVATQHSADLRQDLCADMLVLAQLGKGGRRHAGSQTQILLFHVFIDQELPQFIIANSHFSPLILHMLEQLMRPKVSA
jgi:hypothetical protein